MTKDKKYRETVINGLEKEIARAESIEADWLDCVEVDLLRDIRELLTPEPPRLVTREDFEQPPAYDGVLPCWKENRKPTRRNGWVAIVYGKALQDTETGMVRYWTGVPTEEQRREMAWPGA